MHSDTVPPAAYDIGGKRWVKDTPGFAEAIAHAFDQRLRPRCLCQLGLDRQGAEMYVARFMDGHIVKRMPNTGSHHAPCCQTYESSSDLTGLGQLLSSAITEDPATGETTLKLDFPLTKMPGRQQMPSASVDSDSVATEGSKLSLRALLRYLWGKAELTRWHPGFAGRRKWSTVRRHLLRAAQNKLIGGQPLLAQLYIPESFSVEQRSSINSRRAQQWFHTKLTPGFPQPLMLIIAEVKEIVPVRCGYEAVVKHVPDLGFAIDEAMYWHLRRRYAKELAMWASSEDLYMVMIATFGTSSAGLPSIDELCLSPVTRQWLPVADGFEKHFVHQLVSENRSFDMNSNRHLD